MTVDVKNLREFTKDHPPIAYLQREQAKIAAVWDALPQLLAVYEAWEKGIVRETSPYYEVTTRERYCLAGSPELPHTWTKVRFVPEETLAGASQESET